MKLQFIKELIKNNNMVLFPPKYMHQHQLLQLCLQPVQGKMNYGHRKPWGLNSMLVTARGNLLHGAVTPGIMASIWALAED